MKRRDFIGKTAIGVTGLTIGASGMITTASCKGANDKVVLAIIGSGSRGTGTIINCCKVNENVEIKTVCDVNDLKAGKAIAAIEKELGYKPVRSRNMKEVYDDPDIDAVWISTPEHWHALATVWACQAGKDVYVEKNPTINIWEGRKMVEAAKKYKRIVQIGFQNRSAAYGFSAREYVRSGKLVRESRSRHRAVPKHDEDLAIRQADIQATDILPPLSFRQRPDRQHRCQIAGRALDSR